MHSDHPTQCQRHCQTQTQPSAMAPRRVSVHTLCKIQCDQRQHVAIKDKCTTMHDVVIWRRSLLAGAARRLCLAKCRWLHENNLPLCPCLIIPADRMLQSIRSEQIEQEKQSQARRQIRVQKGEGIYRGRKWAPDGARLSACRHNCCRCCCLTPSWLPCRLPPPPPPHPRRPLHSTAQDSTGKEVIRRGSVWASYRNAMQCTTVHVSCAASSAATRLLIQQPLNPPTGSSPSRSSAARSSSSSSRGTSGTSSSSSTPQAHRGRQAGRRADEQASENETHGKRPQAAKSMLQGRSYPSPQVTTH